MFWGYIAQIDQNNRVNKVDKINEVEPRIMLDLIKVDNSIDDAWSNKGYEFLGTAILGYIFITLQLLSFLNKSFDNCIIFKS